MRTLTKSIILSLLASILVLASVELLARVAGSVDQDIDRHRLLIREDWLVYSPTLGWERKPGYSGPVGRAAREFDAAGYLAVDSRQVAAAATTKKRVVFVGDSNTFGFGVPTPASFVEQVEHILPEVDAINLGVAGYTSYQGRVSLEKHLPLLKPDLVVASFNFNDRRYVVEPEAVDSAKHFQRVYQSSHSAAPSVAEFLELSHLHRGLRYGMRVVGLLPGGVGRKNVTDLKPRVDEDSYRHNLTQIVTETRRLGIPLIFVLLADNPIQSDHLRKGIESLKQKDYDMAIAFLTDAVESHRMFSDLARVYLAQAHEAKGDKAKAADVVMSREFYRSFSGGTPIRLDTVYNDIMRQVAAQHHVTLVDGAGALNAQPSVFIDYCHFNEDGHRRIGELLADRVSVMLGVQQTAQSL